jgi:hypothetical protein
MRISALGVFACVMAAGAADVRYTISTVAGGAYSGDNRSAVQAQLGSPDGVAADAAGNIYVSDSIDHRVRKISPSGLITTVAGNGHFGFRGDGGPADSAQLNAPYGIALDRDGNLYIADLGNSRVRKVSASDGTIRTVAGGGTNPANVEGGDATTARLNQPRNLALDAAGNPISPTSEITGSTGSPPPGSSIALRGSERRARSRTRRGSTQPSRRSTLRPAWLWTVTALSTWPTPGTGASGRSTAA